MKNNDKLFIAICLILVVIVCLLLVRNCVPQPPVTPTATRISKLTFTPTYLYKTPTLTATLQPLEPTVTHALPTRTPRPPTRTPKPTPTIWVQATTDYCWYYPWYQQWLCYPHPGWNGIEPHKALARAGR